MTTSEAAVTFRSYRVENSDTTRDEIFRACDRQMYRGYGPEHDDDPKRPVAYPMLAYRELLAALAAMPHLEVVTLGALCRQPAGEGRVRLAIRHDVDGDIVAALQMAELEYRAGVRSSYYFLHTAAYHGVFRGGVFRRHVAISGVYRQVQALGHEVGLHTDGLTVYRENGVDGAAAVAAEIEWMREQGLDVRGTVAHGSKAAFGAENYEIFRGRHKGRARDEPPIDAPPDVMEHGGRPALLRTLDERTIGLEYEGNDVFFQRKNGVPVEYGATRTVDGWRWNAYRRRCKDQADLKPPEFCTQETMLRDITRLEPGCCVVLTVHPCYYGLRHAPTRPPILRRGDVATEVHDALGWETWVPRRVHCRTNSLEAPPAYQCIDAANEIGMLDAPPPTRAQLGAASSRILFVDGGFLDGREVAVPSLAPRVFEAMLRDGGEDARCVTLAHRGLGITRRWPWVRYGVERFDPTLVVLGITTQEARWSVPAIWTCETGFSRHHPPGVFLDWRDGEIVEVTRARGWAIRRRERQTLEHWPGSEVPIDDALATDERPRVDGANVHRFLEACYGHVVEHVRAAGAECSLMITESGELAGWCDLRDDEREVRQRAFGDHVRRLARRLDVGVIDPYEAVGDERVYHLDRTWSPEMHRVAAMALHEAVSADRIRAT